MGFAGGAPATISAGAQALRKAGDALDTMPQQVNGASTDAAGACGQGALSAAADRFGACWSHRLSALSTEVYAASELADNAAKDLTTAGGGPGHARAN